ncbi:MAG: HEAT repeat domain-containing protein [Chloroflexi bacterium]|nr:HEAT repeat domain-containing protein [Chloroflexota bacterium]
MTNRIASFLQIRAGEARMVALVAALFALIEIGRGLGGNAADGLFFVRFGVENLPYMYLILGVITFFVMLGYTVGLGRGNKPAFFARLFFFLAIALLIERAAILTGFNLLYPILWLTINAISVVLGTLVWSVATETCDTRQAKRLFSLFTSLGILGGVIGNLLTGALAQLIGTENLILLDAAILFACLALTRDIARQFFKPAPRAIAATSFLDEIRVGYDFVRASPLMQLIGFASILFSVLFFSISFPFNKIVSATYPNEADVAGFLGIFSAANTAATFLVSLFIANRLYTRVGVVNAVLLLPITYFAGFVLFAVNFSLSSAIVARFAQMIVLGGIAGSAWSTFFNVVPPEKRGQVQSFDSGVTAQIGIIASGILLLLGDRILDTTQVFILGMATALVCGVLIFKMRGAYGAALVDALRAGYLDVFTSAQRGFQHLGADRGALQTALASLNDPRANVRRVSAEILGKLSQRDAINALILALNDSDRDVRRAALDALVQLDARDASDAVFARLNDTDASVRAAAIDALSRLDPESARCAVALDDPDAHVRAHAAVALHRAGEHERAHRAISDLLKSDDEASRIAGLEAIAESGVAIEFARVEEMARDSARHVCVAALNALTAFKTKSPPMVLLDALNDREESVRLASAKALQAFDSLAEIIRVLNAGSERAQEAALLALEGRANAAPAVTDWALAQIPRAAEYRAWSSALAAMDGNNSRAGNYLRDLLHQSELKTEQRILRALALVGKKETLDLIAKGLTVKNQETRAQAIEALDTLGDKRIARGLIPLLEETGAAPKQDARAVLNILAMHSDPFWRALAVHAIGELLSRDLQTLAERAGQDAASIVREAASKWTAVTGGAMPETLRTLGTIDRILFLRQVPIFNNLAPEDLNQIAEIADERAFTRGEFIFREGDVGDELFVIVEGAMRVERDGRTLRTLQAGEQIGELAILREQPRSASVVAESANVRALVIRGDALKAILRDRPEVAMGMLASLAQRLSTA